ncbi:MAG TPA: HIT family protein [Rhodocyclaceae bacterium]
MSDCELCSGDGGEPVWQDGRCRVVRVGGQEALAFAGFCRVIWKDHVREMTDLSQVDRRHLMNVVFATEAALRTLLNPDKINLASFGNAVPHLHWHVVPRWREDSHFPRTVWSQPMRNVPTRQPVLDNRELGDAIAGILSLEVSGL